MAGLFHMWSARRVCFIWSARLCDFCTQLLWCDVWDFVCMIELKVAWIRETVFAIPKDQINNTVSEREMPIRFELTIIMHVLCFSKSGIGVGITKVDCFLFKVYWCINLHIVAIGRSALWSGDFIRIWKETMLTCLELLSQSSPVETEVNQEELNGMPATG
jgi:hypothetical protein